MIESPCRGVCRIDTALNQCVGCGRTLAEIAGWKDMSEQQRMIINKLLETRNGPHIRNQRRFP